MIEYLDEKVFFKEIESRSHLWVAMGNSNAVFAVKNENGETSLLIWSSRDRANEFLKNASLVAKYSPLEIPLEVFTKVWLVDKKMAIAELQVNPTGKRETVLALTCEEFKARNTLT